MCVFRVSALKKLGMVGRIAFFFFFFFVIIFYIEIAFINTLQKLLRIRSVISVNYHYITVLCPFSLLIRFKCYNTV